MRTRFIQSLSIATFLFAGPALPQSGGVAPVPAGMPSGKLVGHATLDAFEIIGADHYIAGGVEYYLVGRSIAGHFRASQSGPREVPFDTVHWKETVPYWPTAAAVVGHDLVAVAGKGADPAQVNTRIELWRLGLPELRLAMHPQTGQVTKALSTPRILWKRTLYDGAVAGRNMVRAIVRNRGGGSSLFIQFWDSGDVYTLDYSHALNPVEPPPADPFPLAKALRATPGSDVPYVPKLADREFKVVRGSTHGTEGHNYDWCYSVDGQIVLQGNAPLALTLFDHDRDGVLDEWGTVTAQENAQRGLLDDSQYEERGFVTVL